MAGTNGNGNGNGAPKVGTDTVKQGLAQMLKGGVIVSWPTADGFIRFVGGFERHELELSTICRKESGSMTDMFLRHIFFVLANRKTRFEGLLQTFRAPRRFMCFLHFVRQT